MHGAHLQESGREGITDAALGDGSSYVCPRCHGVVSRSRKQSHNERGCAGSQVWRTRRGRAGAREQHAEGRSPAGGLQAAERKAPGAGGRRAKCSPGTAPDCIMDERETDTAEDLSGGQREAAIPA